jgi:hypothetical protein
MKRRYIVNHRMSEQAAQIILNSSTTKIVENPLDGHLSLTVMSMFVLSLTYSATDISKFDILKSYILSLSTFYF